MKIFINTTVSKKAVVSLLSKDKIVDQEESTQPLTAIEALLKRNKLRLSDLERVDYHPGPGSFTGLRIGAVVANTLNFALGKKVAPLKLVYEQGPTDQKSPKG
jgi:tRNA threonylcarbamoyladenosine biosynthesis protein TsaB